MNRDQDKQGCLKAKARLACPEHFSVHAKLVGFEELGAVCDAGTPILVMGLVNNKGMKNSKVGKILCIECNGDGYQFSDILQRVLQQKNLEDVIFLSLLEKDMVIGRRKLCSCLQDKLGVFAIETDFFSPYFSNRPLVLKFKDKCIKNIK